MMAFLSLLEGGVLERHPELRVGLLESGCGWLPYWLWRLDEIEYAQLRNEVRDTIKHRPSWYFRRQCWIAFEPGETLLPESIAAIGRDRVVFGTDFPHPDHDTGIVEELFSREALTPEVLRAALWHNPRQLLGLDEESLSRSPRRGGMTLVRPSMASFCDNLSEFFLYAEHITCMIDHRFMVEHAFHAEHSFRASEELLGSEHLRFKMQRRGNTTLIKLVGSVNENSQLRKLTERIQTTQVVLDLGGIERINSCGVREWVTWLHEMEAMSISLVLTSCSIAIVGQLNMVFNFVGRSGVASFYAPYYCTDCDTERVQLFDPADIGPPPYETPIHRCDQCDMVMEFDDIPDIFFGFIDRLPPLPEFHWYHNQDEIEMEETVVGATRTTR